MELEVLRVGSNLVDFNLISHSFYSFLFNPSHYLDIDICYIIFINLNLQFLQFAHQYSAHYYMHQTEMLNKTISPSSTALGSMTLKLIKFAFPPSNQLLLSYQSPQQFRLFVSNINQQLLGFREVIIYKSVNKEHGSFQCEKYIWECTICYAFLEYRLSPQSMRYTLQNYQLIHTHSYENFKQFIVELSPTEFHTPIDFQQIKSVTDQIKNLRKKKQNMQSNVGGSQQIVFGKDQHNENTTNKNNRKIANALTETEYFQKKDWPFLIDELKKDQSEMEKQLSEKKNWCRQTRKLIAYLQPHSFSFPLAKDLLFVFNNFAGIEPKERTLNRRLKQLFRSQNQFQKQVWATMCTFRHTVVKFSCCCLETLITKCPYKLVYTLNQKVYTYNAKQSFIEHRHLQELTPIGSTKYYDILKYLVSSKARRTSIVHKGVGKSFLLLNVIPKIIQQKCKLNKSLLQTIPSNFILELLKHKFTFHTKLNVYKTYSEIKASISNSLVFREETEQDSQENDVILFINPMMVRLFNIYNRLLIIEHEPVTQQFDNHKKYMLYIYKGISFKGKQIYFGFCLMQNYDFSKLYTMHNIFMSMHTSIPNLVLVSELEPILYSVTRKYFSQNYPESMIKTRQKIGSNCASLFFGEKRGTEQKIQQRYAGLVRNKDSSKSSQAMKIIFNYEALIKKNSVFVQSNTFVGLDMNTLMHVDTIKQKKVDSFFNTNLQQILNCLTIKMKELKETNEKYLDKQLFPLQAQKILKMYQLHALRILMSKKPFRALMHRLMLVPKTVLSISNPPHFYMVSTNLTSNIVTENPAKRNPLLFCDCRVRQRTGIPCQHILKVALVQEMNLMDCIDRFWLIDSFSVEEYAISLGDQIKAQFIISPYCSEHEYRKRIFDKLFKNKNEIN